MQWLVWLVVPLVIPEQGGTAVIGGVVFGLAVVLWWLFFGRAAWSERLGAIVLMVVAVAGTSHLVHESIANGMMGFMLFIYAIPVLSLALVAWAVTSRGLSSGFRRASMVATILLACGVFTLLRTGGITGDVDSDFHWRWAKTPEERLLAQAGDEPAALASSPAAAETPEKRVPVQASDEPAAHASAPAAAETSEKRVTAPAGDEPTAIAAAPAGTKMDADWPGFRGPQRDDIVRGVRIETDWSRKPPVELWRRPIGPGWSSFAVHGSFFYTRSSAGTTKSFPLTTWPPASRCGDTATRSGSGSRMPAPVRGRRRPSATAASTHLVRPES